MTINKNEYQKEKEYLENVKKLADLCISNVNVQIDKQKKEIFEIKQYIWNDCKSLSDLEYGNLLNDTDAKVNWTNSRIKQMIKYQHIKQNPYFGRIDFKTEDEVIKVYVGIYGFNYENRNYIFDWRAPISNLFYDYGIGKAKYEAPIGTINGDIILRRQYKIENGTIERIIESEININDEMLQEVLSNNSSDKMKNIVTTIQKEQNEIIRDTSNKYMIIQGVAGSGKTSVALHRIAYLLYKEKNLSYSNILIFSPNDIFTEYISDVLPELGERNVLNTTFNDLLEQYLKKFAKLEKFSDFLEKVYENNIKPNYIFDRNELDYFIQDYIKSHIFHRNINVAKEMFNKFELNDLLLNKYKKLSLMERISNLAEYLCNKLNVSIRKNKRKIENLIISELGISLDPVSIFLEFLKVKGIEKEIINKIDYEDLEYIIYIYFELNGYPYNSNIKHVVIDEAQDYSELQFYILRKCFEKAYFTILGDVNQAINPYCQYNSLEELSDVFSDGYKYIELNNTYRSSPEILDYSNTILGIKNIKSIRSSNGIPVKHYNNNENVDEIVKNIQYIYEHGFKNVAIITKNSAETNKMYNKLMKKNTEYNFTKNMIKKDCISIMPSYLAKGLEFDGVIIYNDINDMYNDDEKKLYYVAVTRAQHVLFVYNN